MKLAFSTRKPARDARWVKDAYRLISTSRKYREQELQDSRTYYEVLGVPESATQIEVRQAYLTLTKKHHPDVPGTHARSQDGFRTIKHAYEVLRDPKRRREYDAQLQLAYGNVVHTASYSQSPFTDSWTPEEQVHVRPARSPYSSHGSTRRSREHYAGDPSQRTMDQYDADRRREFHSVRETLLSSRERTNYEQWTKYAEEMATSRGQATIINEQALPKPQPRYTNAVIASLLAVIAGAAFVLFKRSKASNSSSDPDASRLTTHGQSSLKHPEDH